MKVDSITDVPSLNDVIRTVFCLKNGQQALRAAELFYSPNIKFKLAYPKRGVSTDGLFQNLIERKSKNIHTNFSLIFIWSLQGFFRVFFWIMWPHVDKTYSKKNSQKLILSSVCIHKNLHCGFSIRDCRISHFKNNSKIRSSVNRKFWRRFSEKPRNPLRQNDSTTILHQFHAFLFDHSRG